MMSVTGVSPALRDAFLRQIERLVTSDVLKGSESLCRLLRFLGEQAVENPGITIKEYQIATEVFGRAPDFDPRLDSTVRVQTGRLRAKLSEYYSGKGAEDRIIVELPKGSYSVAFHERSTPDGTPAAGTETAPAAEAPAIPAEARPRSPVAALWILGVVALGLLAALLGVLFTRPAIQSPSQAAESPVPPAFRTFWGDFVNDPERPWVVFSNAAFVGRPETGMRYFDPKRDETSMILDHYTGVGEVLAMHELDRTFDLLRHGIRVKRGRLLSLDDAKNNDLIFVGSPSENLSLREIPTTRDFLFRYGTSGPRKGDLGISNPSPRTGEQTWYWATADIPLQEDYAVIAIVPGMNPGRWVMILAGITTIGTQAAAEFVTREKDVDELVRRVGTQGDYVRPFEAVIRVSVKGGVPVRSDLVAVHPRQ
jgi:hypothetical protein